MTSSGLRVAVGLSGGVDSSSAAQLLLEDGHSVTGVYMRLWGGKRNGSSCSTADADAARSAADALGIELVELDYTALFHDRVVLPFLASARSGQTLNPCISCNRTFKVQEFLSWAAAAGFDKVATGHHARVVDGPEGLYLARSVDAAKDQSYVLHMLTSDQLSRVLLPLGEMSKGEVRAYALDRSLPAATAPDSMDLCFDPAEVLSEGGLTRGVVVDGDGNLLGSVPASEVLTIGQRRGLDVGGGGGRKYVTDLDFTGPVPKVTVGSRSALDVTRTSLSGTAWVHSVPAGEVLLQVSAHGAPRPGRVVPAGDGFAVEWSAPVSKVAPGQSVVAYDATGRVLGGGTAS